MFVGKRFLLAELSLFDLSESDRAGTLINLHLNCDLSCLIIVRFPDAVTSPLPADQVKTVPGVKGSTAGVDSYPDSGCVGDGDPDASGTAVNFHRITLLPR